MKINFFFFIFFLILAEIFFYWPRFSEWQINSDALEYHKLAVNLLEGKGFYLEEREGRTMFREPGYPSFLFLNYRIFGIHPNLIRIEQVILTLLICFFAYQIARKFFGESTAKITAFTIALHPLFVIYSGEIISEILAAFLVIFFCFALLKSFESDKLIFSLAAGLILGLLALTKSIFIFIPIFALLFYWFINKKRSFLKALLFLSVFFAVVFPWVYRNHLYFNQWMIAERGGATAYVHASRSELNNQQFKNFAISSVLSQYFVRLRDPSFDIFKINIDPLNQQEKKLSEFGFSEEKVDWLLLQKAKNLWIKYPVKNFLVGFLELSKANAPTVPRNSIMFVSDTSGGTFLKMAKGAAIVLIRLFWLFLLSLVFYGILKTIKLKIYSLYPVIFLIVYLNGIIFFLEGTPRFIFPIYSLYFIFFAFGIYCLKSKFR